MELVDKRKVDVNGNVKVSEPEVQYDDFTPTLAGFIPLFDAVLLRELKLPEEGMISTPDAYAEPCLYCEVIATASRRVAPTGINQEIIFDERKGTIARILKGIGTTIPFSDANGEHYLTVHAQDIIGVWQQ